LKVLLLGFLWYTQEKQTGVQTLDGFSLFDLLFHLDQFLPQFVSEYGWLIYILIFVIIFAETGIFAPLPGDSLIFACAAFAVIGLLDIWLVVAICFVAGILGDSLNYYLGHAVGKRIYERTKGRLIKREHIDKAQAFYERHGGKAIVFSRFIPIVRQFTPFVAGIGKMSFRRFMTFNFIGVTAWVGVSALAGHFFGNIPFVKENFTMVLLGIIVVSLIPVIIGRLQSKFKKSKA
jgi:membrane-associated protein